MIIVVGTPSAHRTETVRAFERLGASVHSCTPEDVAQALDLYPEAAVLPTCSAGVDAIADVNAEQVVPSAALCAALREGTLGHIAQNEIGVPVYVAEDAATNGTRVTLIAVRSTDPATDALATWFCEPICHLHTTLGVPGSGGWQPAHMSPAARDSARSIAARVCNHFGGSGMFSLELQIDGDNAAFVSVAPYATTAGAVTQVSQRCSQYELLARAVSGFNVDPTLITPAAGLESDSPCTFGTRALGDALALAETTVRIHPAVSEAEDADTWTTTVLSSAETTSEAQEHAHLAWVALHSVEDAHDEVSS